MNISARSQWSPFFLAAQDILDNRNGILSFANEFFASVRASSCFKLTLLKAVEKRFLDGESKVALHARLGGYFASQQLSQRYNFVSRALLL